MLLSLSMSWQGVVFTVTHNFNFFFFVPDRNYCLVMPSLP